MAAEIVLNTPLADALKAVIQPKLVEVGWSSGGADDSDLTEYIMLMLVNGRTQEQIAAELSGDLLQLGPDDPGAMDFSRWLFEQMAGLSSQINGSAPTGDQQTAEAVSQPADEAGLATDNAHASNDDGVMAQDTDMTDGEPASGSTIPTGPKAMRGNRDKRMMGQLSRHMDRSNDSTLHRVRAQQGTGRVQSHSREPPKGPRNTLGRGQAPRPVNGRGMLPAGNPGYTGPGMPNGGPNQALMHMTPQQQMQLFAMYEEQARMMSQILSPQQQQHMFNGPQPGGPMMSGGYGAFGEQPPQQQPGRSLFERAEIKPARQNGNFNNRNGQDGNHSNRSQHGPGNHHTGAAEGDPTSSMEVEVTQTGSELPAAETVCRFNLSCTKVDCPYAHQSPAAPPGASIDVTDNCPFGAACKNKKCVARHPSPATKINHQAEQDCKFFPNCTNPACPFRHPAMPLCRNGADCTQPGCKFTHVKTPCKYNPCLNPTCPFKHVEGQKRGKFDDKVWVAGEAQDRAHVSERKFVDETAEEELIIPTSSSEAVSVGTELIT